VKFQIFSDIHCEFRPAPVPAAAGLIVAAGRLAPRVD
jgi:hypothetical protein